MEDSNHSKGQEEITQWVYEYGDDLFSWAFYKTGDKLFAEDLVQETFLSTVKSIENYMRESSPKTWLFKILNNKIIDHYRKSAKSLVSLDSLQEKSRFNYTESMFDDNDNWQTSGLEYMWDDENHLLDLPEFNQVLKMCLDGLPPA